MKSINHFSVLSMDETKKLVGGFSPIFSQKNHLEEQGGANNCKGGNCAAATCNKQKSKKAKGRNSNCL